MHNTLIHASDILQVDASRSSTDKNAWDDHLSQRSTTTTEIPVLLPDGDVYDSLLVKDSDYVMDHYQYTKDLCELDVCRPRSQAAQIPPEACKIDTPLSPERW